MWMLDKPNIVKIAEQVYHGILCKYVEDKGWKIVLGDEEYLFRNLHEAKFAIDRIHFDCENWYGGKRLEK